MSNPPLATIAIISIGQMGVGIAKLLQAHNYRIITNLTNRSAATRSRAESASIELLPDDTSLVNEADYILSIVPPRDATATAQRIINAVQTATGEGILKARKEPLYYLDLNAIAPSTALAIHACFAKNAPSIHFIDGAIIGGPPSTSPPADDAKNGPPQWTRPGIPLSSPSPLTTAPISGAHLAGVLNTQHLGAAIGTASALKCCFAALSKGFTALALQSYSTASSVGILPHLRSYLDAYNPSVRTKAERGITSCPDKAYRWVEEMKQIGVCFEEEGGWSKQANVFEGVAGVYEQLAEVVEKSGRGMTENGDVEGAVEILKRGLKEGTITKEALDDMLQKP